MATCTARVITLDTILDGLPDFDGKNDLKKQLRSLRKQSDFAELIGNPHNPNLRFFSDPKYSKERDIYLVFENKMATALDKTIEGLAQFTDNTFIEENIKPTLIDLQDPDKHLSSLEATKLGEQIKKDALEHPNTEQAVLKN
jgi:O-succinylbenzoate synthase